MKVGAIVNHCGDPYLVRLELFSLLGWSLKLHVFLRSDEDEELHDHPWSFWTLVLAGEYREQCQDAMNNRKAGSLAYRPANWKHRVLIEQPCATLILTSPKKREWGFWRDGRFIPWRRFIALRGHNREC